MVASPFCIVARDPAFQSLQAREIALKDRSGQVLQILQVRPLSTTLHTYEVFATHLRLTRIALVITGKQDLWYCACGKLRGSQYRLVEHAYYAHHVASSHCAGVAASRIAPTGDVRIGERRSRMPWRVHAPEYD